MANVIQFSATAYLQSFDSLSLLRSDFSHFLQSLGSYSLSTENKVRKRSLQSLPFLFSSSSIARSRLYLTILSPRERPPSLMNLVPSPTA